MCQNDENRILLFILGLTLYIRQNDGVWGRGIAFFPKQVKSPLRLKSPQMTVYSCPQMTVDSCRFRYHWGASKPRDMLSGHGKEGGWKNTKNKRSYNFGT